MRSHRRGLGFETLERKCMLSGANAAKASVSVDVLMQPADISNRLLTAQVQPAGSANWDAAIGQIAAAHGSGIHAASVSARRRRR